MAASKKHKPETQWDQKSFEKLKATWTPERIAEDEAKLKEIFALAAYSPTMKQALDWANDHGIKFFIDRECENVGGYYPWGSGVFAIADKYAYPSGYADNTITHELRHAWQDYHGFPACAGPGPISGNFADAFIRNALVEADGKAIGDLAQAEYHAAKEQRDMGVSSDAYLRNAFLSWFSTSWITSFYGDASSKYLGQKWGIYEGAQPKRNFELKGPNPKLAGIDISNISDVLRLGVNFSGTENYLAGMPSDILHKQILRPALADTFWGAANDDQKKLTAELRKTALRKKLAPENKRKHHPWP